MAGSLRSLEPEARKAIGALIRIIESPPFARIVGARQLRVIVNSTRRDMQQQNQLWNNYQRCGCSSCPPRAGHCFPAAPPGHSPHALGIAADLSIEPSQFQTAALQLAGRLWQGIGYRWGGVFHQSDPIHFDIWPRGYTGPH
jgi:LAS superfamily LD-carboxypeptidase LdcB